MIEDSVSICGCDLGILYMKGIRFCMELRNGVFVYFCAFFYRFRMLKDRSCNQYNRLRQ